MNNLKILFIVPGGSLRPSTRLRILQFLPFLEKMCFSCSVFYFEIRRILKLLSILKHYNIIFIQKVIFPKWFFNLLRSLNHKIIFDFDDAIYALHPNFSLDKKAKKILRKTNRRLENILLKAKAVIAGNNYLAEYAGKYNQNLYVIPTIPIQDDRVHTKIKIKKEHIIIGWIGTKNNLFYLEKLRDVYKNLSIKYGNKILFKIISDGKFDCEGAIVENKKWSLEEESLDLSSFDIGIMPLTDDEYSRGKCGFKLLQYMHFGIPIVASPVGINKELIINSGAGFIVNNNKEWVEKLSILIENENLRKELAIRGVNFLEMNYSRQEILKKIISVIENVALS